MIHCLRSLQNYCKKRQKKEKIEWELGEGGGENSKLKNDKKCSFLWLRILWVENKWTLALGFDFACSVPWQNWMGSWGWGTSSRNSLSWNVSFKKALLIHVDTLRLNKMVQVKSKDIQVMFLLRKMPELPSPMWKNYFCWVMSQYCLSKSQGTLTTQGGIFQLHSQDDLPLRSILQSKIRLCTLCHKGTFTSQKPW